MHFIFSFSTFFNVSEAFDGECTRLVIAGIAYWRSTNVCVSVGSLVGVVASCLEPSLVGGHLSS